MSYETMTAMDDHFRTRDPNAISATPAKNIDDVESYIEAPWLNKYFKNSNRKICNFPRYVKVLQEVNARLQTKGRAHFARVFDGARVLFHPIVAVEICLARKLVKELGELEVIFAENGWGYTHLFHHNTQLHLLATVAEVLVDDERQAREKRQRDGEAMDKSMSYLQEEVKRLNYAIMGVTHARDLVERSRMEGDASHAKVLDDKCREVAALEEKLKVKCKEVAALEESWRNKAREVAEAKNSLMGLHDMHATILELDFKLHKLRLSHIPRDMVFRGVIISVMRNLYISHTVYAMPVYYVRHFEWDVCDAVINRLNLTGHTPDVDDKGGVSPSMEKKVVEAVHSVMAQFA
eukprot:jgi/Mesvir1/4379/Mv19758-RA.1